MKRDTPDETDIVDKAFAGLREMVIPDGPSPGVVLRILQAGADAAADVQAIQTRRIKMIRFAKIAAAAVVILVGTGIGLSYLAGDHNGNIALAEVYEELQQAKNITWTEVAYQRISSKDGKEVWLEPLTRRCMYKAPGRTRVEVLDPQGQVRTIIIVDQAKGVRLRLSCENRKASVTHTGELSEQARNDLLDHFSLLSEDITPEAKSLAPRQINGRRAQGFRIAMANQYAGSVDLWVNVQTKRVVLVHNPSLDEFDPDNDPARNNPPGKRPSSREAVGKVCRDIVYDQEELDDALFSVEVPDGYTVTERRGP